jgi:hypothetical protein
LIFINGFFYFSISFSKKNQESALKFKAVTKRLPKSESAAKRRACSAVVLASM